MRNSDVETPSDEEIAAWLKSKGTSFWGQGFTIVGSDGPADAVAWVQKQIASYLTWRASA